MSSSTLTSQQKITISVPHNFRGECLTGLIQLSDLLLNIDSDLYTQKFSVFNGSTTGMHVRHCVEFYQCLIRANGLQVNYEKRERDFVLEMCKDAANDAVNRIANWVAETDFNRTVQVEFTDGEVLTKANSSVLRELYFVHEHLIHHLAMIRIALTSEGHGQLFPENFGVASSTQSYRAKQCVQQPSSR